MSNGIIQPNQIPIQHAAMEISNAVGFAIMGPQGPALIAAGGMSHELCGTLQIAAAMVSGQETLNASPEDIAAKAKEIAQACIAACQ